MVYLGHLSDTLGRPPQVHIIIVVVMLNSISSLSQQRLRARAYEESTRRIVQQNKYCIQVIQVIDKSTGTRGTLPGKATPGTASFTLDQLRVKESHVLEQVFAMDRSRRRKTCIVEELRDL